MSRNLLIAYASRYGSTRETAEHMAAIFEKAGYIPHIHPMKNITRLDGFDAAVLGAPLYFGNWHKDALAFIARHRAQLDKLPVAVFALGPASGEALQMERACQEQLASLQAALGFAPLALKVFGGAYRPDRLSLPHRLLACLPASPLHGAPASDMRDWNAIRSWTQDLTGSLL